MTAAAAPRWSAWRPGPRRFLAVVCGLLFAGCAAAIIAENMRRRAIEEGAGRQLAALPPAVLATAGILEDSDGAALVVAEGLLDARGQASVSSPAGDLPAGSAREIVLETVARRPASAHARLLLGQLAADRPAELWKKPLGLASAAAPGLDRAAVALAQRYLSEWSELSGEDRAPAEVAIERAFFDEAFLRASFTLVLRRVGPEAAVRMVPADAKALDTASKLAGASGSPRAAELLDERRRSLASRGASRPAS